MTKKNKKQSTLQPLKPSQQSLKRVNHSLEFSPQLKVLKVAFFIRKIMNWFFSILEYPIKRILNSDESIDLFPLVEILIKKIFHIYRLPTRDKLGSFLFMQAMVKVNQGE
jgi:hypothetical protein